MNNITYIYIKTSSLKKKPKTKQKKNSKIVATSLVSYLMNWSLACNFTQYEMDWL